MGENCIPSYVVIQHCGHLGYLPLFGITPTYIETIICTRWWVSLFCFRPWLGKIPILDENVSNGLKPAPWVQNTFEDDAKENIIFETFDWILISHQSTSVSLKYGVVPYRSYRTFWGGGDILGWLSVDHYPMFVQMLQMTCLGEGWLVSLKYLTWKYDSPRFVSFHKPKQSRKQFNKESPPFLFPFSKVLFGITDETWEICLDFSIFIPRCFTTRSGSMNMQLTWRIRIVIHWAFVCSMVFRNAKKGTYKWWTKSGPT